MALEGRKLVEGDPDSGQGDVINYTGRHARQMKVVTSADPNAVIEHIRYAIAEQLSGNTGEHPPRGFRRIAEVRIENPLNPLHGASHDAVLAALKGQLGDIGALDIPGQPGELLIYNGSAEPLRLTTQDLR